MLVYLFIFTIIYIMHLLLLLLLFCSYGASMVDCSSTTRHRTMSSKDPSVTAGSSVLYLYWVPTTTRWEKCSGREMHSKSTECMY